MQYFCTKSYIDRNLQKKLSLNKELFVTKCQELSWVNRSPFMLAVLLSVLLRKNKNTILHAMKLYIHLPLKKKIFLKLILASK
jgi:hypothetical protein